MSCAYLDQGVLETGALGDQHVLGPSGLGLREIDLRFAEAVLNLIVKVREFSTDENPWRLRFLSALTRTTKQITFELQLCRVLVLLPDRWPSLFVDRKVRHLLEKASLNVPIQLLVLDDGTRPNVLEYSFFLY